MTFKTLVLTAGMAGFAAVSSALALAQTPAKAASDSVTDTVVKSSAGQVPAPTRRELRAAECVAALEVSTEALATRIKAGDETVRSLLQNRLESGTAFIGDVYLHEGTGEARARALANDALEAQKSLGDAELAARQSACADEGAKLLAASNGIERVIVQRMARKRMTKLLSD